MVRTKRIVLFAAALVWLSTSGVAAAAYVNWSEKAYDELVPASSSETIPPGTIITMKNWRKYKNFMPVGMQELWAGKFFWRMPQNAEMVVAATKPIPLPKQYLADTEKYSHQVSLVENSKGGYDIKGYVAGVPFPDPHGPTAGAQILYNEYYAYIPHLITTYSYLGFTMDKFGDKYRQGVREVNFKLKHLSDPGLPINLRDTGNAFLTQNNIIMEPEQSKYINSLQIFDNNPGDFPNSYVFVPSLRRSIRLTTAARCSPLVGSDYTQDDERSMNLQPPIFQAKFIGYKKILVGYPLAGYTNVHN